MENESGENESNDDDSEDENDSEHEDEHENIASRTFINGEEIYMKCEPIKFLNDNKVEVDGKKRDQCGIEQWDDDEYYYIIGIVYKYYGEIK